MLLWSVHALPVHVWVSSRKHAHIYICIYIYTVYNIYSRSTCIFFLFFSCCSERCMWEVFVMCHFILNQKQKLGLHLSIYSKSVWNCEKTEKGFPCTASFAHPLGKAISCQYSYFLLFPCLSSSLRLCNNIISILI